MSCEQKRIWSQTNPCGVEVEVEMMFKRLPSLISSVLGRDPAILLLASLGVTAILLNLEFNLLEAKLYDLRMARSEHSVEQPSQVVLVTLDDQTTEKLDDFAPLGLDQHARLLETLVAYQPQAVGYLVNMNYVHQVDPTLFQSEWSHRFLKAADRLEANGTAFTIGTPFDVNGEILPPFPLSSLNHSVAILHQDGTVFSRDKVTRRALTYLYQKPTFHIDLLQRSGILGPDYRPTGNFLVEDIEAEYFFFKYHQDPSKVLSEPSQNYLKRISFSDLLDNKVPLEELQNKIVLVGTLIKKNPGDFTRTPYSKAPMKHPNLAVHANIIDSILHDDGIVLTPAWVNALITFIVTAFIFWFVLASSPLRGVFATLGLAAIFFGVSHSLFKWGSIWVIESQPLIAIFLSYYLVVPYRLIQEYRKRWDYQRKNEILLQVEKLKTNFISLVTHDLKTPVARIQGLAEVVLKKSEGLNDLDRKSLTSIIDSTDELNRFISSVLELTKIQTNKLELRLESKDVNAVIESTVESFKAQARTKKIKFETQLEPLFPIKMDRNLISKVLNNIIDNAIKYSEPHSKIYISSKEIKDFVEIQVRDEGIGMSREELANLFTRFYRAQNDTTTQTMGSGLGLYLTKYFIEAHQGTVVVDSEESKGSTFTIRLPLELKQNQAPGLSLSSIVKKNHKEKRNA